MTTEDEITTLNGQIDEQRDEIASLKEENISLKEEHDAQSERIINLEGQIEDFERNMDRIDDAVKGAKEYLNDIEIATEY